MSISYACLVGTMEPCGCKFWIGQGRDAPARVRSRRIFFVTIANTPPSTPVIRTTASAIRRDLAGAIFDTCQTGLGCVVSGYTDLDVPQRPANSLRVICDPTATTSTIRQS